MEDRYLFKAKTCNGEWVTGFLHCKDDKWYISNKSGSPFAYEVIPDTICRCTGLKDKNGNLIWENDILNPFSDLKGIVKFGERSFGYEFGFYIEWISKACYRKDFLYWVKQENLGIIGNIFDNPDKCN